MACIKKNGRNYIDLIIGGSAPVLMLRRFLFRARLGSRAVQRRGPPAANESVWVRVIKRRGKCPQRQKPSEENYARGRSLMHKN